MKALLLFALLMTTQAVSAMPYTCESQEMENNKPVLRFRVNPKVVVNQNGSDWDLYKIGVTPAKGFRQIVYGSGSADEKRISLTFVKDGFVIGSAHAEPHKDGMFYGEANLSGVNKNRTVTIKCEDYKK